MPQMEISTFPGQIFWLFVCFFLTLGIVNYWFIPKMKRIQNLREKKIEHFLEQAKSFQNRADKILESYEHLMDHAKEKAKDIILENKKKLHEESLETEARIRDWINDETKIVEQRLLEEEKMTAKEIKRAVDDIAAALCKKIANQNENLDLETVLNKGIINDI